jgi:hypothetical protein
MAPADEAIKGEVIKHEHAIRGMRPAGDPAETLAARLSPVQQRALASITGGSTIKSAAEGAGISRAMLYNWIERDPDFRAAYNAWQRELRESARARLLKAAEVAVETVARRVACDERLAMQLINGLGLVRPGRQAQADAGRAGAKRGSRGVCRRRGWTDPLHKFRRNRKLLMSKCCVRHIGRNWARRHKWVFSAVTFRREVYGVDYREDAKKRQTKTSAVDQTGKRICSFSLHSFASSRLRGSLA